MIVVDAWRADAFTSEITPNINSFAEKSWNFRDHYSGGNATRSGIMSIFYGIPAIHNFWMNLLLEQKGPVLVHQMLKQGYKVEVCASASLKSPEFNQNRILGSKRHPPYNPWQNYERKGPFHHPGIHGFSESPRDRKRAFFCFSFL